MSPYDLAYDYVLHTNCSIFLTGKAGTGKTTLLRRLCRECQKQLIVCAPTGVAAINAEGVTIHSLFQLPPQLFLPTPEARRRLFAEMQMRRPKQRLLANLELLVIDEVSMVRADLLDTIDAVLRRFKHRQDLPFGGVQVLFIGDLYQLSPVAREEEWIALRPYYSGPFFFQARVFQEITPVYIELDHVFRQSNAQFIRILNEVRNNCLSAQSLALLNSRYQPNYQSEKGAPFHIVLSTHNRKVDAINAEELAALKGKTYTFRATIRGTFSEAQYPMDDTLVLKKGARVMFVHNDSSADKAYYNGKLGVVTELDGEHVVVECDESDGTKQRIEVHSETWENIRYTSAAGSDTIEPEVVGTFTHFPLRLAWAVTIHKAQGLTFDSVVIDAADAFAAGQVYVALSRCRSLDGIILLSRIPEFALTNAREVLAFTASQPDIAAIEHALPSSERSYFLQILGGLFDFRDAMVRVESLQRLVSGSTSFNQQTATAFLCPIAAMLSSWQQTAASFQRQLQQIFSHAVVDMDYLTQRLQAASAYYVPKMEQLGTTLAASPVYADDKNDAKAYEEQIEELSVDMIRQIFVMQRVSILPSLETYFAARQSFEAPAVHISAKGEQQAGNSQDSHHPILLKRLLALRRTIAAKQGREEALFFVAHTKLLIAISNALPRTKKELLAIPGMGQKKYALFGSQVLTVVSEYLKSPLTSTSEKTKTTNRKSTRTSTTVSFGTKVTSVPAGTSASNRENIQTPTQITSLNASYPDVLHTYQLIMDGCMTVSELAELEHKSPKEIVNHLSILLRYGLISHSDIK